MTFKHDGGIAEYITKLIAERGKSIVPAGSTAFYKSHENGVKLEFALAWTEATDELVKSYVNGIPTKMGGTHENGLKSGLVKAVRNYIETHDLTPKGVTLTADDIREGIVCVLSAYVVEPQFQGQTKERLNNPETAGPGRQRHPPGAGEVAQRQQDHRRGGGGPHHPGGAGPRGVTRGARRSPASRPSATS